VRQHLVPAAVCRHPGPVRGDRRAAVEIDEIQRRDDAGLFLVDPLSLREFIDFRTGYRYGDRLPDFLDVEKARAAELLLEDLGLADQG
jgi:hypothetical protein